VSKPIVIAVILAGGQSHRMGADKAFLQLGGQPLIARALKAVRDAGIEEVFISGRHGTDYSSFDCQVLLDRESGSGPLAGIESGLAAATGPHVLILAVDLPKMTGFFLRKLRAQCDLSTGVVPQVRGQLEPLAAVYPTTCLPVARDCLRQQERAARHFAEICLSKQLVRVMPVVEADAEHFENWNTPEDTLSDLR
jgi:molybdopterin-guanine dinucleotide biosynthesis protein A